MELGHDVTVATSAQPGRPADIRGVKICGFRVQGNAVRGLRGEVERYQRFLTGSDFEVMVNFAANNWPTDLAFACADGISAKKILSTPGLSKLYDPAYRDYYEKIYAQALGRYDRIVYTSPNYRDKIFGDRHGFGAKAVIIPNGAGKEFLAQPLNFRERYNIRTPFLIVTIANHFWAKGHDFVFQAFRKMARKDATLVIIGDRPHRHSWYSCELLCSWKTFVKPRTRLLSRVPREFIVAAFQEADIFLFGSKLECAPLVMYESFASRTAFVTTDVGNVRDHDEYLKIVRSPDEAADRANALLDLPEYRRELTEGAFALWRRNHTWDIVGGKYDELLQELART